MAKNWCFTLNNYTKQDEEYLQGYDFKYIIYGREVAPTTGTNHLQGYFQLHDKKTRNWVSKHVHPRMHLTIAKGTPEQNILYCSKSDANCYKRGVPSIQGSNTAELRRQIEECNTFSEVLSIDGIERRLTYAKEVFYNKPVKQMDDFEPREWQKELIDKLSQEPDDRHIIWVYDREGGKGKTYLCKYLVSKGAFYFSPSKSADILYAYKNQKIILYDIPRCIDDDYVNWGVIEKLKDGIYFNGKFESRTNFRQHNSHIVVFSNDLPPPGKFSRDRIQLINLSDMDDDME